MNTKISHHIYGWLLVMPAVILMGTFTHLPSVTTLISSFFSTGTKKRPSIFIGAENDLFNMAGCAMVAAPFSGSRGEIVGAIGVIGPSRINYARIIPIVDYTAKVVSRLIG